MIDGSEEKLRHLSKSSVARAKLIFVNVFIVALCIIVDYSSDQLWLQHFLEFASA
jgi:hypothetical protein